MSASNRDEPSSPEDERKSVSDTLREVREESRREGGDRAGLTPYPEREPPSRPLPPVEWERRKEEGAPTSSPDRDQLNRLWDVSRAMPSERGVLGWLLSPLRFPLRRLVRFALGPVVERQVEMNSAQVRFDNELVRYVDDRLDRLDLLSRHHDHVLGLHGRRMGEIDERHLILQQELIRHVHDLVARIEFVFETAEQNHLYVEGMLRENREELRRLADKLASFLKDER